MRGGRRRCGVMSAMLSFIMIMFGFQIYVGARIKQSSLVVRESKEEEALDNEISQKGSEQSGAVETREALVSDTPAGSGGSSLYVVGQFGLGHRLSKLSAAYHLAGRLELDWLEMHWGSCRMPGTSDVFTRLFGTHILPVSSHSSHGTAASNRRKPAPHAVQTILVRNDVAGYYAGSNFKNARRPIPLAYGIDKEFASSPWHHKLETDANLFKSLLQRFNQLHPRVQAFMDQKGWAEVKVVGTHLRAGNGERDHFQEANRAVSDNQQWVEAVCSLLRQAFGTSFVLFVATDTPSLIPMIEVACHPIEVWTYPQSRVEPNQGVSYEAWKSGEQCYQGWADGMSDMALLASVNVLVAATRSTFTQILPRAVVMHRDDGTGEYCEIDDKGLTCWRNEASWLYRTRPPTRHVALGNEGHNENEVFHKVMVHLPDWTEHELFTKARQFVASGKSAEEQQFIYGPPFDQTYRTKGMRYTDEWTWELE